MKERPILFSAPMVRALLDRSKTQTRRVLKPDGEYRLDVVCPPDGGPSRCRYGQPGDRLYVREAWSTHACFDDIPPRDLTTRSIHYMADGKIQTGKFRQAFHMPRWASRILLEVVSVRVERLNDISEADAITEGCTENHNGYFWGGPHAVSGLKQLATAKSAYRDLWESINGPGSWDANPWVWVVEFTRVQP